MPINEDYLLPVEKRLDLHGCTEVEAEIEAYYFLKEMYALGVKKVEVVTGKGLHNTSGISIVKCGVIKAIKKLDFIKDYYSPSERYGGGGVLHIILLT